jgi:hypothetical protein
MPRNFQSGDRIIYCKPKHSPCPGPRAKDIRPSPRGDDYDYNVDKYWIVVEVRPNGRLLAQTRRGKRHLIQADDPSLRRATWWERLLRGDRFPT